jgi:ABC-type glycerol-3-phosphate transport system substrate-binding protein
LFKQLRVYSLVSVVVLLVLLTSLSTVAQDEVNYYYYPALSGGEINLILYEGPGTQHMKTYIPMFEEETGITVNLIKVAESSLIEQEVLDFTSEAGAYDLVQTTQDGADVAFFASAGWLEDLMPYLERRLPHSTTTTFAQRYRRR